MAKRKRRTYKVETLGGIYSFRTVSPELAKGMAIGKGLHPIRVIGFPDVFAKVPRKRRKK